MRLIDRSQPELAGLPVHTDGCVLISYGPISEDDVGGVVVMELQDVVALMRRRDVPQETRARTESIMNIAEIHTEARRRGLI